VQVRVLFISHTSSNSQYIIINTLTPRHTSRARVMINWVNFDDEIVLNVWLFSVWVCVRSAWILRRNKLQKICLMRHITLVMKQSIINRYLHKSGIAFHTFEWLGSDYCLDRNTNNLLKMIHALVSRCPWVHEYYDGINYKKYAWWDTSH